MLPKALPKGQGHRGSGQSERAAFGGLSKASIGSSPLTRTSGRMKVAAGDAFREVRQFTLRGKPEGVALVLHQQALYLEACQQGPHQHSIAIAARRDKHRVDPSSASSAN